MEEVATQSGAQSYRKLVAPPKSILDVIIGLLIRKWTLGLGDSPSQESTLETGDDASPESRVFFSLCPF